MKRGPKPKPSTVEQRREDHKAISVNTPNAPNDKPKPDKVLGKIGRAEWRRMVGLLERMSILSSVDRAALHAYCLSWERYIVAEQHLAEEGAVIYERGTSKRNPWALESNQAFDRLHKIAQEFGLTPASRSRVNVPEPGSTDSLKLFLSKRTGS